MIRSILGGTALRAVREAARKLQPNIERVGEEWRRQFRPRRSLSARAQTALEQLLLRTSPAADASEGLSEYFENVRYIAQRLAKLRAPLSDVISGIYLFTRLAAPYLESRESVGNEMLAAQDAFYHVVALTVSQMYDEVRRKAMETLFRVLDAELRSGDIGELLERLLALTARSFGARYAAILLLEGDDPARSPLHHAAVFGLDPADVFADAPAGTFFRRVVTSGRPGFLLDAANDPRVAQPYFRARDIRSVWAVPLRHHDGDRSIGVLQLAFDRVYEFLPQELELLIALGERSVLALDRARLTASLRESERRVRELSRRLLRVQEEERGRISRDLHDETGQALLALRLYIEMARRKLTPFLPPATQSDDPLQPLDNALKLLDQTVDGLRRILARLSPLLLDELGLSAALRKELRQFTRTYGIAGTLSFRAGRLPRELEIVIYRVIQEALNNVARHAHATHVEISVVRSDEGAIDVRVQDDGSGMPAAMTQIAISGPSAAGATPAAAGRGPRERLGLAGMRERLQMVGGAMRIESAPGAGTALILRLPVVQ
jgi:signal transduction histidine kinase